MREQVPSQRQLFSLPIDALAALAGSMICISFTPIFIRFSDLELSANATIFNRFWIAGLTLLLIKQVSEKQTPTPEKSSPLSTQQIMLLMADGLVLATGLILWAWSLDRTTVAKSSLMHNLVPIFTVLGGWLALGKTFNRKFLVGMAVAIAGAMLLEAESLLALKLTPELIADLVALLSAVFFGIHPLIAERLRDDLDAVTIMTWSSVTSSIALFPLAAIATEQLFPASLNSWLAVIALALVSQILGVGLWTYSLKRIASGFASLVALIIPGLSAIEGWIIFSESLNLLTGVSFVVILLGMYLAISSRSAIKPNPDL
jgi:drug/metabolite transporter (DMT)-like permease